MAYDKVVDSEKLDANLAAIADACRKVKTKAQYDELVSMAVVSHVLTIPLSEILDGVTTIGGKAFFGTDFGGDIVIPEGVESIGYEAFQNTKIGSVTLPKTLKTMEDGGYAFVSSTLTSVTFKGTPTSINATTFRSCSNCGDIYVPWSEGEVANAPWGATSATIHYNNEVT